MYPSSAGMKNDRGYYPIPYLGEGYFVTPVYTGEQA